MSARYWMAFWPPPGPHAKPQGLAVHHKHHHTPERARRAFFHQTSRVASSLRQAGGPKTRTYSRLHSRNVRRIETIQDAPQGQITKTSRPRRGSLDRRARTRETHGMKMLIKRFKMHHRARLRKRRDQGEALSTGALAPAKRMV